MRVNQLANRLGVTADTVRFYTRQGFLEPKKNENNGYKEYSSRDEQYLRFILSARHLGFSVEDIARILELENSQDVLTMIDERLNDNEEIYREAIQLRERLRLLIQEWRQNNAGINPSAMLSVLIGLAPSK